MVKVELVKFWKLSVSGCESMNFLMIFQHCEIGHFSTIWLIFEERVIGFSYKFYYRCIHEQ